MASRFCRRYASSPVFMCVCVPGVLLLLLLSYIMGNEREQLQPRPQLERLQRKDQDFSVFKIPFLIENKYICSKYERVSLLIIVLSTPDKFDRRNLLRQTWLKKPSYDGHRVENVFIVGSTSNKDAQEKIMEESKEYSDIVQCDSPNSFENAITYTLLGFRWILANCKNADMVLTAWDVSFVNLFKYFENHSYLMKHEDVKMYCSIYEKGDSEIIRHKNSLHYVPLSILSGYTHFPHRYCSGFAVFLKMEMLSGILEASKFYPEFPVADYHLYGKLPHLLDNIAASTKWYMAFQMNHTLSVPSLIDCYESVGRKCRDMGRCCITDAKEMRQLWRAVRDSY